VASDARSSREMRAQGLKSRIVFSVKDVPARLPEGRAAVLRW
jgi:hypothetical protein